MKRLFSVFISLALLVSAFSAEGYALSLESVAAQYTDGVSAGKYTPVDYDIDGENSLYNYKVNDSDNTAALILYKGIETEVDVPAEIDGYRVTILYNTFKNNSALTKVTVPAGITEITGAFEGCSSLADITVPSTLEYIGDAAFSGTAITAFTVPDSVTGMGGGIFKGCFYLSSVTLPDGLTVIPKEMFRESAILSVDIPDTVKNIDVSAFFGCTSLTEARLPENLEFIASSVFSGCSSLCDIILPDGISFVGEKAFENCSALTEIIIPTGTEYIGNNAFDGCSLLAEVTLPETLTKISDGAFLNCLMLTEITVPKAVNEIGALALGFTYDGTSYAPVDGFVVKGDAVSAAKDYAQDNSLTFRSVSSGNVFTYELNENGEAVITGFEGKLTSELSIPAQIDGYSVTEIADTAFIDNTEIYIAVIPEGVKRIGKSAFSGCSSMISVVLPSTLEVIDESAFANCSRISRVSVPNGVSAIEWGAFSYCSALTEITLPLTLGRIEPSTFRGCTSLSQAEIPQTVHFIGSGAFYDCSSLRSITIPDGVKIIESGSFRGCTALAEVNLPESVSRLDDAVFMNCAALKSIILPAGLTHIGTGAFTSSGLESLIIPDTVTEIGVRAFAKCTSLVSVNIPASLTVLDEYTFEDCTGISYLVIPQSVREIGQYAFINCTSLLNLYLSKDVVLRNNSMGTDTDGNIIAGFAISGYENSPAEEYAEKKGINFTKIGTADIYHYIDNGDGTCELIGIYGIPDSGDIVLPSRINELTVTGINGIACNSNFKSVTVPETVKTIKNSFYASPLLESVTILSDYIEIGDYSFYQCQKLSEVNAPVGIQGNIDISVYANCPVLTEPVIPMGTQEIGGFNFLFCNSLETITLPPSVTAIVGYAFMDATSLKTLNLSDSVKEITDMTFYNCASIEELTGTDNLEYIESNSLLYETPWGTDLSTQSENAIVGKVFVAYNGFGTVVPEGIISIAPYAFSDSDITEVTLPDSLVYIGTGAFINCGKLTTVIGGNNVEIYGDFSFKNCSSLSDFTLFEKATQIDYQAFYGTPLLTEITIPMLTAVDSEFGFGLTDAMVYGEYGAEVSANVVNENAVIYGYTYSSAEIAAKTSNVRFVSVGTGSVFRVYHGRDGLIITGVDASIGSDIVIPEKIEGLDVVGIDSYALEGIRVVEIPSCVRYIYDNAFNFKLEKIKCFKDTEAEKFALEYLIDVEYLTIPVSELTVSDLPEQTYTGEEFTPVPVVTFGDETLTEGTDYTLSYSDNKNAGTATVTVHGLYPYEGDVQKTFVINPKDVSSLQVQLENPLIVYTGRAKTPSFIIKDGTLRIPAYNYVITYKNNINAGTATAVITGCRNYTGVIEKPFGIMTKSLKSCYSALNTTIFRYNGYEQRPTVTIKNLGVTISWADYTLRYENNINVGNATVTVSGRRNYHGTVVLPFRVIRTSVFECTVVLDDNLLEYNGTARTPLKSLIMGGRPVPTSQYTVTYKNNINIGTATLTVTGKGNCRGTYIQQFVIKPKAMPTIKITSKGTTSVALSWQNPGGNIDGYEIYRAKCANGTFFKYKTFGPSMLSFVNSALSSATVYCYKIRSFKTVNNQTIYSDFSPATVICTKPNAPQITVTPSAESATIKWNAVSRADGYECYYATSANGVYTKFKTIKSDSVLNVTKTALKSGKTYYFKIRAYKYTGVVNVYSDYSTTISVKIP